MTHPDPVIDMQQKYYTEVRMLKSAGARPGEALYCALKELHPELAMEIVSTDLDPYYEIRDNTERAKQFLTWMLNRFAEKAEVPEL